jgi:GTPase SAR1 family protein
MNIISDSEDEGPLLEPPMCTTLVIGRSNTGKSSLCRYLISQYAQYKKVSFYLSRSQQQQQALCFFSLSQNIYVANDLTNTSPYIRVTLEDIPKLPRGILVVEDVIGANQKLFKALQFLLSWQCHHGQVVVEGKKFKHVDLT